MNDELGNYSKEELINIVRELSNKINQNNFIREDAPPYETPMGMTDDMLKAPRIKNHPYLDYINPHWSTTNIDNRKVELIVQKEKLTVSIMADLKDLKLQDNASQEHVQDLIETWVRRSGNFGMVQWLFTRKNIVEEIRKEDKDINSAIRK